MTLNAVAAGPSVHMKQLQASDIAANALHERRMAGSVCTVTCWPACLAAGKCFHDRLKLERDVGLESANSPGPDGVPEHKATSRHWQYFEADKRTVP